MVADYDQVLAKMPKSQDAIFAWHQDMAYWPPFTAEKATATCWLAVSDASVENGCMRFIPGTHKEKDTRPHYPGKSSCPCPEPSPFLPLDHQPIAPGHRIRHF